MNKDKAIEIQRTMNEIRRCEKYLEYLDSRKYQDEYELYHNGMHLCDLDADGVEVLRKYYEKRKADYEYKLTTL